MTLPYQCTGFAADNQWWVDGYQHTRQESRWIRKDSILTISGQQCVQHLGKGHYEAMVLYTQSMFHRHRTMARCHYTRNLTLATTYVDSNRRSTVGSRQWTQGWQIQMR